MGLPISWHQLALHTFKEGHSKFCEVNSDLLNKIYLRTRQNCVKLMQTCGTPQLISICWCLDSTFQHNTLVGLSICGNGVYPCCFGCFTSHYTSVSSFSLAFLDSLSKRFSSMYGTRPTSMACKPLVCSKVKYTIGAVASAINLVERSNEIQDDVKLL
jgi:hypothetical protein